MYAACVARQTNPNRISRITEAGARAHKCSICGKVSSDRSAAVKHVENIHFAGQLSYKCKYCEEVFSARNNMYVHISKYHK